MWGSSISGCSTEPSRRESSCLVDLQDLQQKTFANVSMLKLELQKILAKAPFEIHYFESHNRFNYILECTEIYCPSRIVFEYNPDLSLVMTKIGTKPQHIHQKHSRLNPFFNKFLSQLDGHTILTTSTNTLFQNCLSSMNDFSLRQLKHIFQNKLNKLKDKLHISDEIAQDMFDDLGLYSNCIKQNCYILQTTTMKMSATYFSNQTYLMLLPMPGSLLQGWLLVGMTNTMQSLILAFGYLSKYQELQFFQLLTFLHNQISPFQCLITDVHPQLDKAIQKHQSLCEITYLYDTQSFVQKRLEEWQYEISEETQRLLVQNVIKCEYEDELEKLLQEFQRVAKIKPSFGQLLNDILKNSKRLIPCKQLQFCPFRRKSTRKEKLRDLAKQIYNLKDFQGSVKKICSQQANLIDSYCYKLIAEQKCLPHLEHLKDKLHDVAIDCYYQSLCRAECLSYDRKKNLVLKKGQQPLQLKKAIGGRLICLCGFECRNGMPCQHLCAALSDTQTAVQSYFNEFWRRGYQRDYIIQLSMIRINP